MAVTYILEESIWKFLHNNEFFLVHKKQFVKDHARGQNQMDISRASGKKLEGNGPRKEDAEKFDSD